MASLNTLPYEIQWLILQHIDSTKQLGECRRISKIWDQPAECAMFSKQLRITVNNTRSMYMHLLKKPSRANLIKNILLEQYHQHFAEFTVPLLRLAITPSIEKIASNTANPDIRLYQILGQMVRNSGLRLQRLKSIPWPRFFEDIHYQTALLLKDSLEEMEIPPNSANRPHEISQHLDEFTCLSKLHVYCGFDTLTQVESIFRSARNLREIDIRNSYIDQENVWQNEERLHWMKQHVQINDQAVTIAALNSGIAFIEYFLYKYTNIRRLDYIDGTDVWSLEEEVDFEFNRQACSWISRIPEYNLMMSTVYPWRPHYRLFAGNKNVFRLHYGGLYDLPDDAETHEISSRVEEDGKRTTQYRFWNSALYDDEFPDTHVPFLEEIAAFTKHVNMKFDNPDNEDDLVSTIASKVFFKALEVMNHLKEMKIISSKGLESVKLNLRQYNKRKFSTLHISGAQIQPAMFRTLDRFYHTVTTLMLSSCRINKDQTNTICIHMPTTALEKLVLNRELDEDDMLEYPLHIPDMISLQHDTYFMINLQQGVTLYFKLEALNSHVIQISFADYFSRPRHANAFSIYCRLLASLEVDFGDVYATINVQRYCEETLDAAFSELKV